MNVMMKDGEKAAHRRRYPPVRTPRQAHDVPHRALALPRISLPAFHGRFSGSLGGLSLATANLSPPPGAALCPGGSMVA